MSIYSNLSRGDDFLTQRHKAAEQMEALRAKGKLPLHSGFWFKDSDRFQTQFSTPEARLSPEYVMQLSSIRRAVTNFIKIITGRDIPVHFSTGQMSYAQGGENREAVVLSATTDPNKLDVAVGLALHEANHLIRSRVTPGVKDSIPFFEFLKVLFDPKNIFLPPSILKNAERLKMPDEAVRYLLKTMLNLMEDLRIDKASYEQMPGYRSYYDAVYAFYWYKPSVVRVMADPKSRVPTIRTYRFYTINMTHPEFDASALPGLDEIVKLIDVKNIARFGYDKKWTNYQTAGFPEKKTIKDGVSGKSTILSTGNTVYPLLTMPDMIQTAVEIVNIILENAEPEDVAAARKVLDMPPLPVRGKGLDDDEKDESDPDDPLVPIVDPENLDVTPPQPAGSGGEKDDENNKSSTQSSDSRADDAEDDIEDEDEDTEFDDDADDIDNLDDGDEDEDDEEEEYSDDEESEDDEDDEAEDEEEEDENGTGGDGEDDDPSLTDEMDDILDAQEKMLDGDVEKESIEDELSDAINALEGAGTQMKTVQSEVFGEAKVIIYHKLTDELIRSPKFRFASPYTKPLNNDAILRGIAMGNTLAHRLRVMADESPLTYTRQMAGRLDKRMVAALGYDLESVFQQTVTEKHSPVLVHLSIDSSSSMNGTKFLNAMSLAVSLAQAASKIRNLDVAISFRASGELPEVLLAYDSRVDTMVKIRTMFPYLNANGGTPEGLVFAALLDHLTQGTTGTKRYFINLSDGFPDCRWKSADAIVDGSIHEKWCYYSGKSAFTHTAQQVQQIREAGVRVMSYYITANGYYDTEEAKKGFGAMYGRDAAYINPENVLEIARTLNGMFLTKDS